MSFVGSGCSRWAPLTVILAALCVAGCGGGNDSPVGSRAFGIADDTPACLAKDPAERRATQIKHATTPQGECFDDVDCPCGTYCDNGLCRADCITNNPPPELVCIAGKHCTPQGRCAPDGEQGPAPKILEASLSPSLLTVNPLVKDTEVEVQVAVETRSYDFLQASLPAPVTIGFLESKDGLPGIPLVKCARGATYAESCTIDEPWRFDLAGKVLRSSPKTVWMSVPKGSDPKRWTLEARSIYSDRAGIAVVDVKPFSTSSNLFGHFSGTLAWTVGEAGVPTNIPVDAIISGNYVVLFEPTRLLLPQGHVLLRRNYTTQIFSTDLEWFASDSSADKRKLRMTVNRGDTTRNGKYTATIQIETPETAPKQIALSLGLADGPDLPACSRRPGGPVCDSEHYCDSVFNQCFPGSGPPGVVVPATTPLSTITMRSSQLSQWQPAAQGLATNHPTQLGGADYDGVARAYCFRSSAQSGSVVLGSNTAGQLNDLTCSDGGLEPTFAIAGRQTAFVTSNGQDSFNLLTECIKDLGVVPSEPYTADNLLPSRPCVSVGRFFAGLLTNVRQDNYVMSGSPAHAKLVTNLLRQWLTLHTWVARISGQEREYQDVLGTASRTPPQESLGAAMDVVERGLRLVLDERVRWVLGHPTALAPDYRLAGRPVLHWSFNDTIFPATALDDEGTNHLDVSGIKRITPVSHDLFVFPDSPNVGSCRSQQPVALPDQEFTIAGYFGNSVPGRNMVFRKEGSVMTFQIDVIISSPTAATMTVEVYDSLGRKAIFENVGYNLGYYAVTVHGDQVRLYRTLNNSATFDEYPVRSLTAGPHWGEPGNVQLGCALTGNAALFDEVSVWPYALGRETLAKMGASYMAAVDSTGQRDYRASTVPSKRVTIASGDEQLIALPVHIVESAAAYLELAAAYLKAEQAVADLDCSVGTTTALNRAQQRIGRAVRLATLINGVANTTAKAPGASETSWYPRYLASSKSLSAKVTRLLVQLRQARSCTNPLGISEQDVPLFHGIADGATNRFFASSRYLVGLVLNTIPGDTLSLYTHTVNDREAARHSWESLRSDALQAMNGPAEQIRRIRSEKEHTLNEACGSMPDENMLAMFESGSRTTYNCFIKLDNPKCRADVPVDQIPPDCLRGELGRQLMLFRSATIDLDNAQAGYRRAIDRYASEMSYCVKRQEHLLLDEDFLKMHQEQLKDIRDSSAFSNFVTGVFKAVATLGVSEAAAASQGGDSLLGGLQYVEGGRDDDRRDADYQELLKRRADKLDLMACFHGAEMLKSGVDATREGITASINQAKTALIAFGGLTTKTTATFEEAKADLAVASTMAASVPPHFNFWIEDHVEQYRKHFRQMQRLSYLAVRSFEYESQQSLDLRQRVLTATQPDQLEDVLTVIQNRTSPMQDPRWSVSTPTAVVSLRDNLLALSDSSHSPTRLSSEPPPMTPAAKLQAYLNSESSKIYVNHVYKGRGIRFAIRDFSFLANSCAERIYRVTAALQRGNGGLDNARLVLWQENSFGSKACGDAGPGDIQTVRTRMQSDLLSGDTPQSFIFPERYRAISLEANPTWREPELGGPIPEEKKNAGFAGRGLYANYILLFPYEDFEKYGNRLNDVGDVLLRFDLVDMTNIGDPDSFRAPRQPMESSNVEATR